MKTIWAGAMKISSLLCALANWEREMSRNFIDLAVTSNNKKTQMNIQSKSSSHTLKMPI